HFLHYFVAMRARLVDDPGEDDRLVALKLDAARKRSPLAVGHVVADALVELERAVLQPDLGRELRHAAVLGELLLRNRNDKTIDVIHDKLPAYAFAVAR